MLLVHITHCWSHLRILAAAEGAAQVRLYVRGSVPSLSGGRPSPCGARCPREPRLLATTFSGQLVVEISKRCLSHLRAQ